jgi:hypothetical protein
MASKTDPQSEPHVQDSQNDPPPSKGTNEPWKRPGQTAQNPDWPESGDIDLEKWQRTNTH